MEKLLIDSQLPSLKVQNPSPRSYFLSDPFQTTRQCRTVDSFLLRKPGTTCYVVEKRGPRGLKTGSRGLHIPRMSLSASGPPRVASDGCRARCSRLDRKRSAISGSSRRLTLETSSQETQTHSSIRRYRRMMDGRPSRLSSSAYNKIRIVVCMHE